MANLQSIQEVLEECPTLYFECRTNLKDPDTVFGSADQIQERYMVDYDQKRAVVFSTFEQNGSKNIVTTVYENNSVHHYYNGLAQDDETQLSPNEYASLFAKGGPLRPVNTDAVFTEGTNTSGTASERTLDGSCEVLDKNRIQFTVDDANCDISLQVHIL